MHPFQLLLVQLLRMLVPSRVPQRSLSGACAGLECFMSRRLVSLLAGPQPPAQLPVCRLHRDRLRVQPANSQSPS